jgi:uncharacterized protein (UPF0303 family)
MTDEAREPHAKRVREIEAEEMRLGFDRFGFAEARRIGEVLLASAPAPVAVRIVLADRVLFAAAQDGTSADNALWLDLKLATVRHFGHSSLWLHHANRAKGRTLADVPAARTVAMADHGGGFPLRIGGQVVGGIAVSGLSHEDDHRLVAAAIAACRNPAGDGPVDHVVLFRWKPGTDPALTRRAAEKLAALPERIPGILRFAAGIQNSREELGRDMDFGFVMTFTGKAARDAYLNHPAHVEVVETDLRPILEEVLVFDFAHGDAAPVRA